MVYEKCEYYLNGKKYSYEINDILWKMEIMQSLKNAANFLVA
jgi:hypothetical protein